MINDSCVSHDDFQRKSENKYILQENFAHNNILLRIKSNLVCIEDRGHYFLQFNFTQQFIFIYTFDQRRKSVGLFFSINI